MTQSGTFGTEAVNQDTQGTGKARCRAYGAGKYVYLGRSAGIGVSMTLCPPWGGYGLLLLNP